MQSTEHKPKTPGAANKPPGKEKDMTSYERFEETLKNTLIKAYTDEYGTDAWTSQNDQEKSQTLHELLDSLLTAAKSRSQIESRSEGNEGNKERGESTIYEGIEITVRASGKFQLNSPVDGALHVFDTIERAKYYIDHAEVIDSHARAMARLDGYCYRRTAKK